MKYTIYKDSHFSSEHPAIPKLHYKLDYLNIRFSFDPSTKYRSNAPVNQLDINKLYGITWGYVHHNSFRIGWNYNPEANMIDIWAYYYNTTNNKKGHQEVYLTSVQPNNTEKEFRITFGYKTNTIFIYTGTRLVTIPYKYPTIKLGYYLYPYFGGDETAPNTMSLNVTEFNT